MTDLTEKLLRFTTPEGAPTGAPDDDDAPTPWVADTLEKAAWASRKAAAARRDIARLEAFRAAEKARVDRVVDTEAARCTRDAEFFEEHLADYLAREIAAGRKTKSLELPGGTIKLTARQPRLDVDSDAFLSWAKDARPDLVRTKLEPDKAALKKAAQLADDGVVVIDGEIVPGATWEAQGDSATFTPAVEVTS